MQRTLKQSILAAMGAGWAPPKGINWSYQKSKVEEDAKELLQEFVGEKSVWLPEYDKIVEWIAGNKGKGIYIYGKNGVGKSVFATRIIPTLLLHYYNLMTFSCSATDLHKHLKRIKEERQRIVIIDDVGSEESVSNDFGNKTLPFPELVDYLENCNGVLIATSNIGGTALYQKYQTRTYDRIAGITTRVPIDYVSFRSKIDYANFNNR